MRVKSILERWHITEEEFTVIVDENPSLRGFTLGYIGEYKLRDMLQKNREVTALRKPDDHDRKKGSKNDLTVSYKGFSFTIEVKSLQTNLIKFDPSSEVYTGKAQVDASDSRPVTLSDGSVLKTACLLRGGFDLLAINLFQFREVWDFAFILNRDLPSSTYRHYTPFQREQLLPSLVSVSWPVKAPFVTDPFILLDRLVAERESGSI